MLRRPLRHSCLNFARFYACWCAHIVLLNTSTGAAFGFLLDPQARTPLLRPIISSTTCFALDHQKQLQESSNNSTTTSHPHVVSRYEPEAYEEYSSSLSARKERKKVLNELEPVNVPLTWSKRIRKGPGQMIQNVLSRKRKAGKLILLRCGESTFNANGTFTGWLDPDLTAVGVQQCRYAAQVLKAEGFEPDVVYTSRLTRAIKSAWYILEELDLLFIAVHKTVRLNQRMYGALQGLSKEKTAAEVGAAAVHAWRNSLKARPPALSITDPTHPRYDRRYADLSFDEIPSTESLLDCQERARPLWEHKIKKDIEDGKTVLVVGHRDAIRGLIKSIDRVGDTEIEDIRIPKCIPFVYRFREVKGGANDGALIPIPPEASNSLIQEHTTAQLLETPASLRAAVSELTAKQETSAAIVGSLTLNHNKREVSLRETLANLRSTSPALNQSVGTIIQLDDDDDADLATQIQVTPQTEYDGDRWNDDPSVFEEYEYDEFGLEEGLGPVHANMVTLPESSTVKALPIPTIVPTIFEDGEPFVVLIRHGRTPHNNLGLFTGWEDPPLAEDGIQDAINAGRLLKRHNFEFDVVYTSWLTRAIQTAYYALSELDAIWIPIIKSWRLNERHYGNLTGKSKNRVANEYGAEQLKKWRRGYTIRPPSTSSYSPLYPGNDERRAKHFDDVPISLRETINRSIEQRRFVLHRKFPKSESLKDCMDRSIPFYTKQIYEEAVRKGKRVLITSHENALRGILMHLCDIPESAMNQLHLPNGLPLVYNVKGKCITLLDDGTGRDPMEIHDFGPAAKYLFKPCELDDEFYEKMAKS